MKVKLYKGPMHGKTYDVRPGELRLIFVTNKKDTFPPAGPWSEVTYSKVVYEKTRMLMDGKSFPAMHPDGSIFFEYKETIDG